MVGGKGTRSSASSRMTVWESGANSCGPSTIRKSAAQKEQNRESAGICLRQFGHSDSIAMLRIVGADGDARDIAAGLPERLIGVCAEGRGCAVGPEGAKEVAVPPALIASNRFANSAASETRKATSYLS